MSVSRTSRIALAMLVGLARAAAASPLDDPRLGASASDLAGIVEAAARGGLPDDLLADKVREGLAKDVPAARILAAVRILARGLGQARDEAGPGSSRPLLKAIVDAHAAGASSAETQVVLKLPDDRRARAVQVLTDLVQRSYPAVTAARTIRDVGFRNPAALEQLATAAERLRTDGATASEALDALARASAQGLPFDRAAQLVKHYPTLDDDNGRGPNRESAGPRGPRSGNGVGPDHSKGHP